MNELQIFNNPELGDVRVIGDFENPRFCLSDVCRILELPQVAKAVQRLGDEVLSRHPIADSMGRMQEMYFVNEDGLYDLVLDSRKPAAKKLRKWLTSEVVPSIRKTGMYIDASRPISGDQLILIGQRMKELENQVAELKPDAEYCRLILQSKEALPITIIAKDYGYAPAAFNTLLYERCKIQYPRGNTYVLYQDYVGKGYTDTVTKRLKNGLAVTHTYWTQKGRQFIYEKLKAQNILPLCEQNQISLF